MKRKLKHKRILITGAAGGLGLALARDCAARGARVALADINSAALEILRSEFPDSLLFTVDVTDADSVAAATQAVRDSYGGLDMLINNAGVVYGGELHDVSIEKHRRTVDINLFGTIQVTRAFLPLLRRETGFLVVFIASASGYIPLPMAATYAATKWAVRGFALSLEEELVMQGCKRRPVLTVCPSYIGTGLFSGAKAPLLTPILETTAVSRAIVRAIAGGARQLDLPWSVRLLKFLARVLPESWYRAFQRVTGVSTSMVNWTGR